MKNSHTDGADELNRKCYFAPMEGIAGYIYRNAHHTFFPHTARYFTPFIVPTQHKKFSPKELKDVQRTHNEGMDVVPQILTNRAEYFIWTARELKEWGYEEVNLNLGCPSRTVVSKNRGSGFLAYPEELNRFLDQIFSELDMKISIKTRIGVEDPEEFAGLLDIYNRYPVEELIIHPRLQSDYYKNTPHMKIFTEAWDRSQNTICYNGDIFNKEDYDRFISQFPDVQTVMLGRGLLANPGLWEEIMGRPPLTKQTFKAFHDMILEGYREVTYGDRNVLFKMKELWFYMKCLFPDSVKYIKKIKKTQKLSDYEEAVLSLLNERDITSKEGYRRI